MATASSDAAVLTLPDGRTVQLRVLRDVAGQEFVDISTLYAQTGVCTFDVGFSSTASCASKITYIDGDKGQLLYRGYPIEQLAESGDALDCIYLLMHGELPNVTERARWLTLFRGHRLVQENLIRFFRGFNHDANPMAIMCGVMGALSAFYNDQQSVTDPVHRELACINIIAKIPVVAAIAYKVAVGEPIVYPREDLTYSENLLYMMFALPTRPYVVDKVSARCLETILILHMDHEQNASTSTVRIAGSSQASPYACVAAGIASLWGPAHGGANAAVIEMLEQIGHKDRIPEFVAKAKDKNNPFRLMGFGHRVYKTMDPRAVLMRKMCHKLLDHLNMRDDPLLELAMELEKVALADPYFVQRRLYPNVDFYSGICFRAMGIPVSMFTVLFAVGRATGWVSQWREMTGDSTTVPPKISRPRQMYMGALRRDFVPLEARPDSIRSAVPAEILVDPRRASLDKSGGPQRSHCAPISTFDANGPMPVGKRHAAADPGWVCGAVEAVAGGLLIHPPIAAVGMVE